MTSVRRRRSHPKNTKHDGTAKSKLRQKSVWRHHCEILAPNVGELIQSAWSASELSIALFHRIYYGTSPSLCCFISFHSALLIRCRSTITVYVISQKPATIIITFPRDLCCIWQESFYVFYCFSDCRCWRCSHRHFKLRRTFSINWTVDTPWPCCRSRLQKLPFITVFVLAMFTDGNSYLKGKKKKNFFWQVSLICTDFLSVVP